MVQSFAHMPLGISDRNTSKPIKGSKDSDDVLDSNETWTKKCLFAPGAR